MAEGSAGYLRMKSCSKDDNYMPMNTRSNDYLTGNNPSYLIPQSSSHDDDDNDDDAFHPAAAADNVNGTYVARSTRDNAQKPLINNPNDATVPDMKYSDLQQDAYLSVLS